MKKIKRLSAFVLTLIMLFSMSLSAFADTTVAPAAILHEITIDNTAPGHAYDAYQIFQGDLSENEDDVRLSNIKWGQSIKDGDALIEALTNDTKVIKLIDNKTTTLSIVFANVKAAIEADKQNENPKLTDTDKARMVAETLKSYSNDSSTLDRFAEVVGAIDYNDDGSFKEHKYLNDEKWTSDENKDTADATKNYTISDMPSGYYLIKDRDESLDEKNEGDFYSKYIVRVVKSDSLVPKGEGVKVTKTVNDTIDGTYTEYEDSYTNDTLYYKWVGTLPNNLSSYDKYHYEFIDVMSKGLDFIQFEQIYVENKDGSKAHTFYDITDELETNNSFEQAGIVVSAPKSITVTENEESVEKWQFSLEFTDLLKSYPGLLASQTIVVKYSARINRYALLNKANPNEVKIKYDNNPNGKGTGTTVPDDAYMFTFKTTIDKYDSADPTVKLENVTFYLYYQLSADDEDGNPVITKYYAQVLTEEMVGQEMINNRPTTTDDVGIIYAYTTNREEASVLDTDQDGAIYLKGLDAGIYYLEEIDTVAGYNRLDTPVQIEISPQYNDSAAPYLTDIEYEVDGMLQHGANEEVVGVRNSQGSMLPSTGGIGTTIFYVVGGVLAVGAVVILVTKKRMSNEK